MKYKIIFPLVLFVLFLQYGYCQTKTYVCSYTKTTHFGTNAFAPNKPLVMLSAGGSTKIIENDDGRYSGTITWHDGFVGEANLTIDYRHDDPPQQMRYYEREGSFGNIGSLNAPASPLEIPNGGTEISLQLSWVKPSGFDVDKITHMDIYVNNEFIRKEVDPNAIINITATLGFNYVKVYPFSRCGQINNAPLIATIEARPSCAYDIGQFTLTSGDYTHHEGEEGYEILSPGEPYTFTVSGISDFFSHYDISHNGGESITLLGNTFTVHSEAMRSYRIEAVLKEGRGGYCNAVEPLPIFVNGSNTTLKQKCPIILPDDLGDLGLNIDEGDPALTHFKATVVSDYSIIVKPGVVLESGAELKILPGPDQNTDSDKNYIQNITRNEYGEVIGITRQYFDEFGRPTQAQSKNLADGIVLASETIYDAYGRPVINTLAAPVSTADPDFLTYPENCKDVYVPGDNMVFGYKENFVTAATGVKYNHTHFDLVDETSSKEENPDPVLSDDEGTLAWYYSSKNGTSTNPLINEPMTPTTEYPYSRTIYHRDGSGEVKSAAAPGEAYRAGSGNLSTQNTAAVDNNDPYLKAYFVMAAEELGVPTTDAANYNGHFFKSISWDDKDRKSETYQDLSGNSIMSLYYGDQLTPTIKSYQFYDVAGRLKASISPNGVEQYNGSNYNLIDKTTYTYNAKGWLVKTKEPDAGASEFVYRKDGSIRFSQNAQQFKDNTFSYTHYDRAGRPVASGEYLSSVGGITFNSTEMKAILESREPDGGLPEGTGTHRFQTFTGYDSPGEVPGERVQRFVMGNVSWSKNENTTTWYSYDDVGRVEWVVQEIAGLGTKTIDYRYGPDGNVREVAYQKGDPTEDFYHYYTYDANGRLNEAFTATELLTYNLEGELENSGVLKLQATYEYYLHGPLKRVVIADGLQGIDYLYTINGALKAINHADPAKDPGADGVGNDRRKDVFGMTLDYYPEDYKGADYDAGNNVVTNEEALYNGNIKAQSWHVPVDGHEPKAYVYEYDERNQLKNAAFGSLIETSATELTYDVVLHGTVGGNQAFKEAVNSYDKNGNIQALARNAGGLGNPIADYTYDYEPENAGDPFDNKLKGVTDGGTPFLKYEYNAIGQMTRQTTTEGTEVVEMYVDYDVTGKVIAVYRDSDKVKPITKFVYDDRGFRLAKLTFDEEGKNPSTIWYVRDASGMVLSTYFQPAGSTIVDQIEVPIYGAGKIGIYKPMIESTYYEFTDHLGNVRAVIGNKETITYMATMESEMASGPAGNPQYEDDYEDQWFDIKRRAPTSEFINHTTSVVALENPTRSFNIANPNEVVRINNKQESEANGISDGVGAGITLKVNPGDVIHAEVFAKYANFEKDNKNVVPDLAGFLSQLFFKTPVGELGSPIFDIVTKPEYLNHAAWAKLDESQPRAFLSYLLYDNNLKFVDFGFAQVSPSALIESETKPHDLLDINDIKIEKGGYIYIYVSNENDQDMDVYFDDLKITQEFGDIVAGGDYYPFGLAMDTREVTREDYRYGYQGQFAEMDEETGWNHFESRQYNSRIGKWISPDPAGQFDSPYVGMGNNPVNGVDPDGEWVKGAGLLRNLFYSDERLYAERYAESWSSEQVDYTAAQMGGRWGIIGEDKASIMSKWHTEKWMTFSAVNKDGMVEDTDGWFSQSQLASGAIYPDLTLELFLMPVAKGASLIYNATVRGVLKSSLTGASRLGGSAAKINYYTYKAAQAGYSTSLSGARVRAGVFVQLNHNVGRMMLGKGWKTLYSNAPATIIGRQWQNQAFGSGLLGIGVGTGSLYYNINY